MTRPSQSKNPRVRRIASTISIVISFLILVFTAVDMMGHPLRPVEILTLIASGIGVVASIISLRKQKEPDTSSDLSD